MKPVQTAIVTACAYEIIAITTKKVPTISFLCRKYRAVEVGFLAWLIVHLHRKQEVEIREIKTELQNNIPAKRLYEELQKQATRYRQRNGKGVV